MGLSAFQNARRLRQAENQEVKTTSLSLDDLEGFSLSQLKEVAGEIGLDKFSRKTKGELVNSIWEVLDPVVETVVGDPRENKE